MGTISLETVEKFKGVSVMDISTKAQNQTNPISMGINVTFNDRMCSIHCNGSQGGLRFFWMLSMYQGLFQVLSWIRTFKSYCPLRLFKFYLASYNIVNMASEDKQLTQDYIVDKWKNRLFTQEALNHCSNCHCAKYFLFLCWEVAETSYCTHVSQQEEILIFKLTKNVIEIEFHRKKLCKETSFVDIKLTYHTSYPFKVYNFYSFCCIFCCIFRDVWPSPQSILEHFYHSQWTHCPLAVTPHLPPIFLALCSP